MLNLPVEDFEAILASLHLSKYLFLYRLFKSVFDNKEYSQEEATDIMQKFKAKLNKPNGDLLKILNSSEENKKEKFREYIGKLLDYEKIEALLSVPTEYKQFLMNCLLDSPNGKSIDLHYILFFRDDITTEECKILFQKKHCRNYTFLLNKNYNYRDFLDRIDDDGIICLLLYRRGIPKKEAKELYWRIKLKEKTYTFYRKNHFSHIAEIVGEEEAKAIEKRYFDAIEKIIRRHIKVLPNRSSYYAGEGDNGLDIDIKKIDDIVDNLDRYTGNIEVGTSFLKMVVLGCDRLSPSE